MTVLLDNTFIVIMMMFRRGFIVARKLRLYVQPIVLGVLFFVAAVAVYATVWNLVIAYDVFPAPSISTSGMITITTFLLTTSTFVTNQTTTTEASTTKISNQTATTVLNETVTATRCPAGVTSCTGTAEQVNVIVNRPIILIGNLRIGQIPVFDTALSPSDLSFYHSTYYSAVAVICATYVATSILSGRRKLKMQTQRRLRR